MLTVPSDSLAHDRLDDGSVVDQSGRVGRQDTLSNTESGFEDLSARLHGVARSCWLSLAQEGDNHCSRANAAVTRVGTGPSADGVCKMIHFTCGLTFGSTSTHSRSLTRGIGERTLPGSAK